jgi:enoyl-CoA hydratase/carnithine racemase
VSHEFCRVEADGHLLTVILNRPDQHNALHKEAHYELAAIFDEFDRNPKYWVAILTGAGSSFCAGADLKSGSLDPDYVPSTGFAGLTHRFDRRKPVIAAVNGLALGGGLEAALACDIIVASESAKFGLPEVRVGLYAAAGGIQRLVSEIGNKRASAMLLTGRKISAREGLALGFVNEVVPDEQALDAASRWAEDILKCSPSSIGATKAMINEMVKDVRANVEAMMDLPAVKAISNSPDMEEGVRAFRERRVPKWSDPAPWP